MEDLVHCKSISLRSWQGKYVVAEENGAANANRNDNQSRFTDWEVVSKLGKIRNPQKMTTVQNPDTHWTHFPILID